MPHVSTDSLLDGFSTHLSKVSPLGSPTSKGIHLGGTSTSKNKGVLSFTFSSTISIISILSFIGALCKYP